jgi:lipoprotein-anchoring transpeptidase ErfK/SrfK
MYKIVCLLLLIFKLSFLPAQSTYTYVVRDADVLYFTEDYLATFYPNQIIQNLVFVSIMQQKLYVIIDKNVVASYPVSTSKFGLGNIFNSQKTPLGLHIVKNKMGDGVPMNGIIKYGFYSNEIALILKDPKTSGKDLITSRILWLDGLEKGKNKGGVMDSYNRGIYIHGTNEEGLIGTPASHGCIRMKNKDVIDLFNLVPKGIYVLILDN